MRRSSPADVDPELLRASSGSIVDETTYATPLFDTRSPLLAHANVDADPSAQPISQLHRHVRVSRSHHRPNDVFFLPAERFFNVATAIDGYGSAGSCGGSLHERSHGESLILLFSSRC